MRFRTWVIVTAFVLAALLSYIYWFVNPIVADSAHAKIEALIVKSVNNAVSEVVSAGTYRNLTDIRYDANGKITSVSANILQMNGLSSDIALSSQGYLELFSSTGIAVPAGTFSGLPILTGKGFDVKLSVVPVGAVNVRFDSQFTSSGINQTRHRIMLKVRAIVNLVMPLGSRRVEQEIEAMLCENIIIGEVPEFVWTR